MIVILTRKICRKCRLVKCLKVGMRKDWVQNDDDKKSRINAVLNSVDSTAEQNYYSNCNPIGINRRNFILNEQIRQMNSYDSSIQDFESISSTSHSRSSMSNCLPGNHISSINQYHIPSFTSSSSPSFTNQRQHTISSPLNPPSNPSSVDLTNKLLTKCPGQSREDIHSILQSTNDSDWLIRFLVESHALNSRLTSSNLKTNEPLQESTFLPTNQHQQQQSSSSSSPSDPNQCTRVGVIVDGRKLVSSPPVGPIILHRHEPNINQIVDNNFKTRVIRKILDANFAPSHLKQGCRDGVDLNPVEISAVDCLYNAFNFFNQPSSTNGTEFSSVEGVTRFTDLYLEKLISGCRTLPSYSELCLEDQINLVKCGFPNILAIKSNLSSDSSSNCWQTTNQLQWRLENSTFQPDIHRLANDPKVVCILITIVLFNPDLPNLQAVDTVKLKQYTYIYLLRRYLESQCGSSCRARTEHFNLILAIEKVMFMRHHLTSIAPNHG